MFLSIKFRNFKSLKNFSVRLKSFNVLVGPNNAGKSTVLDAFRLLSAAIRYASRRNPTIINVAGETHFGYDILTSNLPISLANIHSDYNTDEETSISFSLKSGNTLQLRFYNNSRCILIADAKDAATRTTKQFKTNFPLSVFSFPTLGPLEEEEELLTDEYVLASQDTRRAHRMFRKIWYRRKDFDSFRALVEQTWEGMSVSKPELDLRYPPTLTMFCKEGRVDRELCWAGFGFQVWLQLLTHFLSASNSDVLIVDEPEIYLHPDLQHRLFHLLKGTGKQVVLATHFVEIVNEAEHDDIVLVNRVKKTARRIGDIDGLQEALFSIGSAQNVHLARLSKGRKLLFLEGDDYRLIRRFASRLKLTDLAEDINLTVVPIGGFSQRHRIEDAAWTFEKVLKAEISIAAILDRDYRCCEEIDSIVQTVRTTVPNFFVLADLPLQTSSMRS
jgi:energy-coupling factor transporter ATP-binding protein EcfA2